MQHGRSREKRKRLLYFNDKTPFSSCADVSKYLLTVSDSDTKQPTATLRLESS